MQRYEIDRMAREIRHEIESEITAGNREIEAQMAIVREGLKSYPALLRAALDAGNPSPATPAPVPPAPEPTLAQRLEEMEPQVFFAAMQADPRAMLAKIAQADQEG